MPEMKLKDLRVMFEIVRVFFEITEPSFTISGDCSTKRCEIGGKDIRFLSKF